MANNFSARPGVAIADDPTILLPLTADFPIAPMGETINFDVAPFVGGGIAISTGSDSIVRPLIVDQNIELFSISKNISCE